MGYGDMDDSNGWSVCKCNINRRVVVVVVFSNVRYRFCLWYIMRKVLEKYGYII